MDIGPRIISREQASALSLKRYFTGAPCRNGHVAERYTSGWSCVQCGKIKGRASVEARNPSARRYGEKTEEQKRAEQRARANKTYWRHRERILERGRLKRKERASQRPPKPPKATPDIEAQRAKSRAKQEALRRRRGDLTMAEFHERLRAAKQERTERIGAERAAHAEARRAEVAAQKAASKDRARERGRAWRLANPGRAASLLRVWKRRNPEKVKAAKRLRGSKNASRRAWLMKVQRGRCAICRQRLGKETHIDHVIPLKLGGSNRRSNLQLTCPSCNMSKGARHPLDHARSLGRLL